MSTLTTNMDLFQPGSGETGWGDEVSANFETLDSAFSHRQSGYTLYYDGTNYSARNEWTGTVDSTGSSLHVPWNFATQAMNNAVTTKIDSYDVGGVLQVVNHSTSAYLDTAAPLRVHSSQLIKGGGRGVIIRANASFPNTGTALNGTGALISAGYGTALNDTSLRLDLQDLTLDCNSRAAQGILYRRDDQAGQTIGSGHEGMTRINNCEVFGFNVAGIQIGIDGIDDLTASSNTWLFQCWVHQGATGSKAVLWQIGDGYIDYCNIANGAGANSYALYINESQIHVRNSHIVFQSGTSDISNVYVAAGGSVHLANNYIDNVKNAPAVDLQGGSRHLIHGNHVNGLGMVSPLPVFRVANGLTQISVQGNRCIGSTGVGFGSLLSVNAASAADCQSLGNRVTNCAVRYDNATPVATGFNVNTTVGGVVTVG